MLKCLEKKTYEVWYIHCPKIRVVVSAASRGKAKYEILSKVRDGYPNAKYIGMRARRSHAEML